MAIVFANDIDQFVEDSYKPLIFGLRVRNEDDRRQSGPNIMSRLYFCRHRSRSFRLSPPTASAVAGPFGPSTSLLRQAQHKQRGGSWHRLAFCDSPSRGE